MTRRSVCVQFISLRWISVVCLAGQWTTRWEIGASSHSFLATFSDLILLAVLLAKKPAVLHGYGLHDLLSPLMKEIVRKAVVLMALCWMCMIISLQLCCDVTYGVLFVMNYHIGDWYVGLFWDLLGVWIEKCDWQLKSPFTGASFEPIPETEHWSSKIWTFINKPSGSH